jgi:serine/threonine protein kinase
MFSNVISFVLNIPPPTICMTDNKNSLTDANSAEGVPPAGATPSSSADSAQREDSDATLTQTAGEIAEARELSARGSQPPSEVDGYSFIRQIGEGSYGAVWLAREDNTGKQVAIKFYTHRRGLDWSLLNREVEKLAVLYTSRNIIGLLDVGWDNDPPYYVMEYLENGSLASYLADGPLPVNEAVRITRLIAQALVQAHGAGILHCDLKPANVLLDSDFEPRLCDFGQSRLSNEQDPALGTLFYMAREQADLQAIPDARWDVYALGALMYKMLTGEPPHGTPENHAIIREAGSLEDRLTSYRNVLSSGPPPEKHRKVSGVDRRLADIISRCIQVDPQKRYPNAQAVLDRLEYRDRHRARRPLMLLGIVGPGLLLAAMAPIFFDAMASNVATLEEQLTNRALESDAVVAASEAHTLEVELALRGVELIEAANAIGQSLGNEPDFARLRALVKSRERKKFRKIYFDYCELPESGQPAWLVGLNREKHNGDKRLTKLDRGADTSWFMTDKLGFQMW